MANNSGFPSLTALLGLLAVAGYQNRDKLAELLGGSRSQNTGGAQNSGLGALLSGAQGLGVGGLLNGGIGELLKRFQAGGMGETAESWVRSGPNLPASQSDLEGALGQETLLELEQKTGLSRADILSRLTRELPEAIDRYTPEGEIPRN